jgi:hypothetical protein
MTSQDEASLLSDNVRDAYIDAAPGPGVVTDAAAQACYGYLITALEDASDPPAIVREAVTGLIGGAKKLISPFWHAARGALVGVVHAGVGQRLALEPLIEAGTVAAMDAADALGGDFGAAAQGAVEGCILAADELSLDEAALGSCAATAALTRSTEMVEGAHEKVQHLVTRRVLGITIDVPDNLRSD